MSEESETFSYESSQYLRIPLRRIGAVIGVKGTNREAIEEKTETVIVIDSDTGEVEIRPGENLKDPVKLFKARDIVKAIGRGFSPEQSIKLADDDYYLEIIRLKPLIGDTQNRLRRVKGRIIGTDGKTRKSIEELTKVSLVVSGSTVSIIGNFEQVNEARETVMSIINGSKIESVIGRLEQKRQEIKKSEQDLWKEDKETAVEDLYPEEDEEEDIFENYDDENQED
jgi:ribosomal RNA assembly protein